MAAAIMTSGGLALMRDYLAATFVETAPWPPQYIALASGTTVVTKYDNGPWADEVYRADIVYREVVGETVTYYAFAAHDQANQFIARYALVGGADVSAQPGGTGTYIAVAGEPVPFGKDATKAMTIQMSISVSGVLA